MNLTIFIQVEGVVKKVHSHQIGRNDFYKYKPRCFPHGEYYTQLEEHFSSMGTNIFDVYCTCGVGTHTYEHKELNEVKNVITEHYDHIE